MNTKHYPRLLSVPDRSFFLFGPRGVGKSTWLRDALPKARVFDLLEYSLHLELEQDHGRLEAMAGDLPEGSWIVMDETGSWKNGNGVSLCAGRPRENSAEAEQTFSEAGH